MRTKHTQHPLPSFPVYCASFLSDDKLVLGGGGGGSTRSGVKNQLRLYKIPNDHTLELISEYEFEPGEDAPMSMASDTTDSRVVCGVNGTEGKMALGENQNCRLLSVENDKFTLDKTITTLDVRPENQMEFQKVTILSPGHTLLAVAGTRDLSVLSYPALTPVAHTLHTDSDIYDAAFSPTTLAVATTSKILLYKTPTAQSPSTSTSPKRETRSKKKKPAPSPITLEDLELIQTVERPALPGIDASASTFRAIRFHPSNPNIVFTVQNADPSGGRSRGRIPNQGFICRWNAEAWQIPPKQIRKIGIKGITCFDVSANGKYLAYGAADKSIGILDATTLAPLLSVLSAHEFPPTIIRFNPSATLLVSGSPDCCVRAVAIPENLTGTTWTVASVFLLTLFILLLSILISYSYSNGYFN